MKKEHSSETVRQFFAWSNWLDSFVLRPLSHIAMNWEASWDHETKRYEPEDSSFAEDLNIVIELIVNCPRPLKYHEHEDVLVQLFMGELKWPIQKRGGRWIGADYHFMLEQGAFRDLDQNNLIVAATGRVHAALDHGQNHFDEMEDGHLNMLAALLSIIIYHRDCVGISKLTESECDDAAIEGRKGRRADQRSVIRRLTPVSAIHFAIAPYSLSRSKRSPDDNPGPADPNDHFSRIASPRHLRRADFILSKGAPVPRLDE